MGDGSWLGSPAGGLAVEMGKGGYLDSSKDLYSQVQPRSLHQSLSVQILGSRTYILMVTIS